jgi:hypothetical protein
MRVRTLTFTLAALATVAVAGASGPAAARPGGYAWGGHGWSPHLAHVHAFAGPRHFALRRFHHHRRFAFIVGYPYVYGDGCYWLKRRAIYTGSSYWWHRYYACRHGYY